MQEEHSHSASQLHSAHDAAASAAVHAVAEGGGEEGGEEDEEEEDEVAGRSDGVLDRVFDPSQARQRDAKKAVLAIRRHIRCVGGGVHVGISWLVVLVCVSGMEAGASPN